MKKRKIIAMYKSGMTYREITKKTGLKRNAIRRRLDGAGFKRSMIRHRKDIINEASGRFFVDSMGYCRVRGTENDHGISKRRAVLIMKAYIGSSIPKGHVVHHKDGNKLNDKIWNLKIRTRGSHLTVHNPRGW